MRLPGVLFEIFLGPVKGLPLIVASSRRIPVVMVRFGQEWMWKWHS